VSFGFISHSGNVILALQYIKQQRGAFYLGIFHKSTYLHHFQNSIFSQQPDNVLHCQLALKSSSQQ
jgi:hypothetical protein